jgi:hypothetical protein
MNQMQPLEQLIFDCFPSPLSLSIVNRLVATNEFDVPFAMRQDEPVQPLTILTGGEHDQQARGEWWSCSSPLCACQQQHHLLPAFCSPVSSTGLTRDSVAVTAGFL